MIMRNGCHGCNEVMEVCAAKIMRKMVVAAAAANETNDTKKGEKMVVAAAPNEIDGLAV